MSLTWRSTVRRLIPELGGDALVGQTARHEGGDLALAPGQLGTLRQDAGSSVGRHGRRERRPGRHGERREHPRDVRVDGVLTQVEVDATSALLAPAATSRATSASRAVSPAKPLPATEAAGGPRP